MNKDDRVFSAVSRVLNDPKASKANKSVAASALTQRRRRRDRAVTRLEVIRPGVDRLLVLYDVSIELSYQDDDRTLKIFISDRKARP